MIIVVVLLIVALVCAVVPASLGTGALGWFIGGMLVWAFDVLLGGYVVATPTVRRP